MWEGTATAHCVGRHRSGCIEGGSGLSLGVGMRWSQTALRNANGESAFKQFGGSTGEEGERARNILKP